MCNGRGKQIIFGLCDKWFHDVCRFGYSTVPAPWQEGEPKEATDVRMVNRYSPNVLVDIPTLQRRLEAANIMIHFPDALLPEGEGEGRVPSDHI